MSDFTSDQVQKQLHENDFKTSPNSSTMISVPIAKPENIGKHMAVDEKYINGEFYTLLTNGDTGKIALMASTTKSSLLSVVVQSLRDKLSDVEVLTRDLAINYDWFGRTNFFNAVQVADKFHVLKQAFDSLQDLRVYHRQKLLTKYREAYEEFKTKKKDNPKLKFEFSQKMLPNGETHQQLLARSRYLLYKNKNNWSDTQKQRAKILFKYYPDIETAHRLICEFRSWYAAENIINMDLPKLSKKSILQVINQRLDDWIMLATKADIPEINNFKSLVERNKGVILNYFYTGKTNAIAESNNSIIQNIINSNRGIKNLDFFFFRLTQFLA